MLRYSDLPCELSAKISASQTFIQETFSPRLGFFKPESEIVGSSASFNFKLPRNCLRLTAQIVPGDQDFLVGDERIPDFSGD